MKTHALLACILTWNALAPSLSDAQHAPGQIGITLGTGAFKLVGGAVDHSLVNPMVSLGFSYALGSRMDLEATADWGWVRPRSPDSHFTVMPNAPFRTYLFPWALRLKYRLLARAPLTPYISLGGGLVHWNLRNTAQEDNWFPLPQSGTSLSGNQLNASLLLAVGFIHHFTKSLAWEVEGRYSHLLRQDLDNIGTGDVNTGLFTGRIGLTLCLGGRHDTDGDGILDKVDGDPNHPEDFDGYMDADGVPDPDNDHDGVPDWVDQAPDQPEDIDGFQDEDGVPDLDNDDDGVPDVYDKAPNVPEDIDGFQDGDGIPDLDNDGDGIPDTEDPHPNTPESAFEPVVEVAQEPEATQPLPTLDRPLVLTGVTFLSGSAQLTTQARAVLAEVTASLAAHPEVRVEIRGFTDSSGPAAANLTLSQHRAEAVRDFLVAQGVENDRVWAVGYGEASPVADNGTAEGRAMNRRIELIQIQ